MIEIEASEFEELGSECGDLVPEIRLTDRARRRIRDRANTNFVARRSGVPIGFLVGYDEPDGYFYVYLFGVAPASRGAGVGSSLFDYLEEWVSKRGLVGIRLQSRNKYPDMLRLMIRRGYAIVGFEDRGDLDASPIRLEKKTLTPQEDGGRKDS